MIINILEDITTGLASEVLTKVEQNVEPEIVVNIMSRGGDVNAGSAIIDALKLSPATVTTKVFGVAASMAAAVSQAGDVRLIAEDATFQPHNSAALPNGRPTKETLKRVVSTLEIMDNILLKSFQKSNLSQDALANLLIEDKPLTAKEATKMGFFDGSMEALGAAAYLNQLTMSTEKSIIDKLKALKAKFIVKAEEHPTEAPTPEGPAAPGPTDEPVTRAEFDELLKMVAELMKLVTPEEAAPTMEEVVEAKLNKILEEVKSEVTIPVASTPDLPKIEKNEDGLSVLEARQKEIQSKFN